MPNYGYVRFTIQAAVDLDDEHEVGAARELLCYRIMDPSDSLDRFDRDVELVPDATVTAKDTIFYEEEE